MDYTDDHDSLIEGIVRLVQLLLVVEEEESKWQLVQDKLLPEAKVQVVRFDLA